MPRLSASKAERLVLVAMGVILVASLGVLYKKEQNRNAKLDPGHTKLSENLGTKQE